MAPQPPTVDDLLERNKKYAQTYKPAFAVADFATDKVNFPTGIIISCCDPRIIPEEYGLFSRDAFVVVRNAGGRAEPAIRDIVVLQSMADIKEIVVVHHVDCGLTHLTNDIIRKTVKDRGLGDEHTDTFEFGEIKNLEQSVRDDVAFLQASNYVKKDTKIHGFVFNLLTTGTLIPV